MIVELRFDRRHPRLWMQRSVARLTPRAAIRVVWVDDGSERPAGLESLLDLERMLLRHGQPSGADVADPASIGNPVATDAPADMVIDFTAAAADPRLKPRLYLRPLYNGQAGENAILAAVLGGDLPVIEIRDEISGAILDRGRPSNELAEGLAGALDTVTARTTTLLDAILGGGSRPTPPLLSVTAGPPHSVAALVLCGLVRTIALRIYRLCCYAPHWRIGWRHTDDHGIWTHRDLSGPSWNAVRSPATSFYADPFPVTWQGRSFVFFEELDHRIGKGFISAIEFGADGPIGAAFPVLEEPWHLSYPFLIAFDGALWMIPESTAQRNVALYKCVEFPHRWERHATLLSDVEFADATIVRHDGRHYMFGASRDGAGGYSDTLSIYHAEHPLGPWHPHAANPVLLDRASTRPAGAMVTLNGRLWRPTQDCSTGYGGALGLVEVDALSPTTFKQTVRQVIQPGPLWPGRKLHTLNRDGRLEVIDGTTLQPKLSAWLSAGRTN